MECRPGSALAVLLLAGACGGGEYTEPMGPGAELPPEAPPGAEYTDDAGRLYALTRSSSAVATLTVVNARDGSITGTVTLGPIDPGGFSVDPAGTAFAGDRATGAVHRIRADLAADVLPATDPRVIASGVRRTAFIGESAVAVPGTSPTIALASSGEPLAASFDRDGSTLAIARDTQVHLVSFGALEATAWGFDLASGDACMPHVSDIAFAPFGSDDEWRALDSTCGRIYGGTLLQDTAATLVLSSSAIGTRIALDGWTADAWIAGPNGVTRVDTTGAETPIAGAPGGADLALANAGTRAWIASTTTGSGAALTRMNRLTSLDSTAAIGAPGDSILGLEYVDRPPLIAAPSSATASTCGSGWVQFDVSISDPDGDPAYLWLDAGSGGSFDPASGTYRGYFHDQNLLGYDDAASFTAISGQWLTHVSVEIYVSRCQSDSSGEYDDDDDDVDRSWGCSCGCTVGSPAHAAPLGTGSILALASIGLWRRRRDAGA